MVFNTFNALKQEVAGMQMEQQRQAAATAGLSSATAAGISGLAAAGMSEEQAGMLNSMKTQVEALVAAEQPRPCHCPDVLSNIARVAYLEVQVASVSAAAT